MKTVKVIKNLNEVIFFGRGSEIVDEAQDEEKLVYLDRMLAKAFPQGICRNDLLKYFGEKYDELYEELDLDDEIDDSLKVLAEKYNNDERVKIFVDFTEYEPAGMADRVYNKIAEENKIEELLDILADEFPDGATDEELDIFLNFKSDKIFKRLGMENVHFKTYDELLDDLEILLEDPEDREEEENKLIDEISSVQLSMLKEFVKNYAKPELVDFGKFVDTAKNIVNDEIWYNDSTYELDSSCTISGYPEVLFF